MTPSRLMLVAFFALALATSKRVRPLEMEFTSSAPVAGAAKEA